MIATIISDAQSGFIPGRKTADNIIMASELVKAYSRKHISPLYMLKIDLQKAHDSVEWVFLQQVMEALCFPKRYIQWVMKCIHMVIYSIMINGEPTKPFDASKGLDKGIRFFHLYLSLPWNT